MFYKDLRNFCCANFFIYMKGKIKGRRNVTISISIKFIKFLRLRAASPATNNFVTPFMKQAVSSASFNPSHPKHSDSDGVSGESNLARKMDFMA